MTSKQRLASNLHQYHIREDGKTHEHKTKRRAKKLARFLISPGPGHKQIEQGRKRLLKKLAD